MSTLSPSLSKQLEIVYTCSEKSSAAPKQFDRNSNCPIFFHDSTFHYWQYFCYKYGWILEDNFNCHSEQHHHQGNAFLWIIDQRLEKRRLYASYSTTYCSSFHHPHQNQNHVKHCQTRSSTEHHFMWWEHIWQGCYCSRKLSPMEVRFSKWY